DITAQLIRRLTDAAVPPRNAFLVLQAEAASRFSGQPRMTLAALLIAPSFSIRILHRFARSDFVPQPSVDAVFVRLHKRGPPMLTRAEAQIYRDFVAACFASRHGTLDATVRSLIGARAT